MLPNSSRSGSKLARALWRGGCVFQLSPYSIPSAHHSSRSFTSIRLLAPLRRPARAAVCVRCNRATPQRFVTAFSTSTPTSAAHGPSPTAPVPSSGHRPPSSPPPPPARSSRPQHSSSADELRDRNRRLMQYVAAVAIFALGASYAAVPLYRLFCQVRHTTLHWRQADLQRPLRLLTSAPPLLICRPCRSTPAMAALHSAL